MSQQNLAELRAQARMTYRYWHIYLMLRLREIEQHLAPEDRVALALPEPTTQPDARILHEAGLLPEDIPLANIPTLTIPEAAHYSFRIETQLDGTQALYAQANDQMLPLMRISADHSATLNDACERFNALLQQYGTHAVFPLAQAWAMTQGARRLTWQSANHTPTPKTPALPKRRRGRGRFREPRI